MLWIGSKGHPSRRAKALRCYLPSHSPQNYLHKPVAPPDRVPLFTQWALVTSYVSKALCWPVRKGVKAHGLSSL